MRPALVVLMFLALVGMIYRIGQAIEAGAQASAWWRRLE